MIGIPEKLIGNQTQLERFISPEVGMDESEQYEILQTFWSLIGLEIPSFDQIVNQQVKESIQNHKSLRFLPAPLLDLQGRELLVEQIKKLFPRNIFTTTEPGLWVPTVGTVYGELLRNPDGFMMNQAGDFFRMGYISPTDRSIVLGRTKWLESVRQTGMALESSEGVLWTSTVTNVSATGKRISGERPGEIFSQVDPLSTPETALTIHLLHQAVGLPNTQLHVNFVNEAVCKQDTRGQFEQLIEVSGVRWYPQPKRVRLGHWDAQYYPDSSYGVLETV